MKVWNVILAKAKPEPNSLHFFTDKTKHWLLQFKVLSIRVEDFK